MSRYNAIAIAIIAAGVLVAVMITPIGGGLMILFGMACGGPEQ